MLKLNILGHKAQIASVDIIMATIIFMGVAAFVLTFLFSGTFGDSIDELDAEGRILMSQLTSTGGSAISISQEGSLSSQSLENLIHSMLAPDFYDQTRLTFDIDNEFCIHIEDEDGNLVYLHEIIDDDELREMIFDGSLEHPDSVGVAGLGSDSISVGGVPCVYGEAPFDG